MDILNITTVASVDLAELRVSADELTVYEAALTHLLDTLSPKELELTSGASRDEIEGLQKDIRNVLAACGVLNPEPTLP